MFNLFHYSILISPKFNLFSLLSCFNSLITNNKNKQKSIIENRILKTNRVILPSIFPE